MVNWENTEYVNPRQRKMKDLETEKIYTFEIQDDPDNIVKQSQTPVRAENLNKMQTDLVDDMSKNYTGTNITANTVEGFGIIHRLYGYTAITGTGDKSPDNPYKIECIGDDINLFDGVNGERTNKYINDSGQEVTGQSSDVFIKQVISVASNRLIMSYEGRIAEPVIRCSYFNRDTFISREVSGENNHVFNVPENTSKIDIRVDSRTDNLFKNLKLQFGTVATTYSPYNKGTVVVKSSNNSNTSSNIVYVDKPLCCLKDAEDNIVAQDYIDYEDSKIVRQCDTNVFDENSTVNLCANSAWTNKNHIFILNLDLTINGDDYAISNKYKKMTASTLVTTTEDYGFCLFNYSLSNVTGNLMVLDKDCSTVEEFKNKLSNKNLEIIYKTKASREEIIDCSNKIMQYENTTNVYNEYDTEMEIELTNNKAISEINEDIQNIQSTQRKTQNYSTEEQIIGRWIDGKPLYRKVIHFGSLPNSTTKRLNIIQSTYRIKKISGFATNNSHTLPLPYVNSTDISNSIQIYISEVTYLEIKTGIDFSTYDAYVFLEYTKTTD